MSRTSARIIAVSPYRQRAEELVRLVAQTAYKATSSGDIVAALESDPDLLIVDARGWESTCRAMLEDFEKQATAPPAVLFAGGGESILYEAGPALGVLKESETPAELSDLIRMAVAGKKMLSPSWKRLTMAFEDYDISRVEKLLLERTGIAVREDRREILRKAMFSRGVANLSSGPHELESLIASPRGERDLAIITTRLVAPETYFWRYSGQMQALKELLDKPDGESVKRPIKVWCAGCSTGEEAYSVAMALVEEHGEDGDITVWGTDINLAGLEAAKRGVYSERSVRNLPERFVDKWLSEEGGFWRVKDSLRKFVRFEGFNIMNEAAKRWAASNGPFDAVFCRNVAIYFDAVKSREVHSLCGKSVVDGGGYFLGAAEMLVPVPKGFAVVHKAASFYYQKAKNSLQSEVEEQSGEALQNFGEEMEDLYRIGLLALGREDFEDAKNSFKKILSFDPGDSRGNTGLAVLLTNQGREVEARELLEKALEKEFAPAEAYYLMGLLEERAGHDSDALALYGLALGRNPEFFMAHINRAWILKRRGRTKTFRREMEEALEVLRRQPQGASWATGGLSFETILKMVAEALGDKKV